MITENELNELKNLEKKVAYLNDLLGGKQESQTESEEEDDEEVEEIQPKKKNIKKQRMAVSAEVYGNYNKKGDFKPKVIEKTDAQI